MVLLKKVDNSDAGTTDQVGGNDWDKLADYYNNLNIVSEAPTIDTDTLYRQDRLQTRNSANTFGHKHRSLATAARTFTIPDTNYTLPERLLPATWTCYKAGSVYKAMNIDPSVAVVSGSNFKVDVWDNIINTPATFNHIHMINGIYDIASGQTLAIANTNTDFHLSGESMYGVRIHPLGNTDVMTITNNRRSLIENLSFDVDQGASFTSDMLKIIGASGGGTETITLNNLKMRHDDGTSALTQTGRNLVLLLSGVDPDISWITANDCHVFGGDSAIELTSASASGALAWCNEVMFNRFQSTHSNHYFLSNLPAAGGGLTASRAHRWTFDKCSWQTAKDLPGMSSTAMFKIVNNTDHRFHLKDCRMWDPLTTSVKFLDINSTAIRFDLDDCEPISDVFMGGTSWDASTGMWASGVYVRRKSELSERSGVATLSDGGTVTHGMRDLIEIGSSVNVAPRRVFVQPTVAGEFASVTAKSTTTFTVALKKWTGGTLTAGTSQPVYWHAYEFA